ncbi:DNA topoisomerase III [Halodesulfovibrio marinisediminis]|uniref:DNA topoisomerase n=1 Tax=Halodesulfovibrio marinisediminis DSM 17456 TaxID=1121457 RepID=A0A1N6JAF0_9BACT|nr:DNA topoisomerase III [Halodesulfovibrio marinisediminis]SIO41344.1 DNA topoisomerase-3 [Halodesulfovibrio marinisediminis DSM 17456]
MRLFIAEKPSLGRAIAEGLGSPQKNEGYITCGDDTVTWCFGHLLELANPDDYKPEWKKWDANALPIIPDEWKVLPRKGVAKQLNVIKKLLKKADVVVNAGDPDREGQLLVDEVLEHFGYVGNVQRIWLASLDEKSVTTALSSLKDNKDFATLSHAALARSRADWLTGINATRAMTLLGRSKGMQGVLSLGRVQTPTLNLIVTRDKTISNFKPQKYAVVQATLNHENGSFKAQLQPSEDMTGLDEEGRLIDTAKAEAIAKEAANQTGTIVEATSQKKTVHPPLPHCLSSLQKAASAKFGMSAKEVLDIAQRLYEKKLTTYPRSDCRYLPEEQFDDAQRILQALSSAPVFETANPQLKSKAWNTKKVTAHHGIIPTGQVLADLPEKDAKLFELISTTYALQFHPPLIYEAKKIVSEVAGYLWSTTGQTTLEAGWTTFDKQPDEQALSAVKKADEVSCTESKVEMKQTKPPAKFTEGTLIAAMASIHRFIDDTEAKKTLKENEGIGTEATRAGIIETLKQRGYIKTDKKNLISTELGQHIITLTPEQLKDPITTALWESRLSAIAAGTEQFDTFMSDQAHLLPVLITPITESAGTGLQGHPCPECGKTLRRLPSKKEKGKFFWACFEHDKPVFLPDIKGKPGTKQTKTKLLQAPCPEEGCDKVMRRFESKKKKGTFFWVCENKEHPLRSDDNETPGEAIRM